jgi:hypothetical protein
MLCQLADKIGRIGGPVSIADLNPFLAIHRASLSPMPCRQLANLVHRDGHQQFPQVVSVIEREPPLCQPSAEACVHAL